MALLFYDGFEGGLRGTAATTFCPWSVSFNASIFTDTVRTGARSFGSFDATVPCLITKALSTSGGFVAGMALQITTASPAANTPIFQVREGSTVHLSLEWNTDRTFTLKRGAAGTTLATSTTIIPTSTWVYWEFKGTIDNSTGSYEVRLDGATEFSASSVDTQNGGTATWDRVGFNGPAGGNGRGDDVYVCDTSGSAPYNTFLGPVKVETLLAQAGNGSNTGLTTSTGSDHGALVDDSIASPNGDTDYNASANVGDKDTYNMSNMSLTGTVLAVKPVLYVKKTDAAARTVCPVIRHSGTDYDGSDQSPLTSYAHIGEQIYTQNPGTSSAFASVSEVNALEIGMKVTA